MTREEIRQVLIDHYKCDHAGLDLQSQQKTVLQVSRLMTRAFTYTPDNELPTDKFLSLKRGTPDQWVSRHVEIANKQIPVKGDCDDYTLTGVQCALILGVNPSRLGVVAVVDETTIRNSVKVKPQINHLIGGFYNGQDWLCCFDTWNESAFEDYLVPIGIGRNPSKKSRHSGQLIAIANEGLRWRKFPESWN